MDRFIKSVCKIRLDDGTVVSHEEEKESKESNVKFVTKNGVTITFPESLRWKVCEVLFEKDHDGNDFVTTFLDAVMCCPVDVRALIVQNVIVLGGVVAALPNTPSTSFSEALKAFAISGGSGHASGEEGKPRRSR